jgi:hypothetical protein
MPGDLWPKELGEVFARSVTAEFATLNGSGAPVTVPTTPYVGKNATLDVSTGLTYPSKAQRARRNPRVCLLFADPLGESMGSGPVVLVQGHAAVRDSDLQSNTDRYTRDSAIKVPDATKGQPRFVLRRMAFYYARIWIEITPVRILWWADRSLGGEVGEWLAGPGVAFPDSDPPPTGPAFPPWKEPPSQWRSLAEHSLSTLPLADLTTVDDEGYPVCVPVTATTLSGDEVTLRIGTAAPSLVAGPACLTLHGHPTKFTGQENHTFMGRLEMKQGEKSFRFERALADWSLAGGRPKTMISFLAARRLLAPRLAAEAARRGQAVPKVRF